MTRGSVLLIFTLGLGVACLPPSSSVVTVTPPPLGPPEGMELGAQRNSGGAKFNVYSSAATRVTVEIFAEPLDAQPRVTLPLESQGGFWTVTVPERTLASAGLGETLYYGYRAWGPNWDYVASWTPGSEEGFVADVDALGNRFNPNKLLSDPYGRELSHDPVNASNRDGRWFASGPEHRRLDSGTKAPKSVLFKEQPAAQGLRPNRALRDDIVYEVHVRGLTAQDPSIPPALRGTYAGAALKAESLAALGITAVEFLPVQETQNDTNDVDPLTVDGDNYWGYMTLAYFAPERRYAADRSPGGPTREWKAMVEAFHAQGIKVLIDVVYNHTGEGGSWGDFRTHNVLSFRGLDNASYYSLAADRRYSWDNTGVGGNYNTFHPIAQNLIVDSLRYWHEALGVDGFRFDLASVLGNTCEHGCFRFDKLNPGTALNRISRELPVRPLEGGKGVDLIAEPWAIEQYQVGDFPQGWAEWNDRFRDTLRKGQNRAGIDSVPPAELSRRIAGSVDLYGDDGRAPASSINFLTAHDGFTLADLYGCNGKNNGQLWPLGPSDGGGDSNLSWDQGGDPLAQRQAARTGMMLLMLSAGTPMLTGGDELLRSLRCNNNPYNVDSPANWLPATPSPEASRFRAFTSKLIAFRKAHPALRPTYFLTEVDHNGDGLGELEWFTATGGSARGAFMDSPSNSALGFRLDGVELHDSAAAIYVAYNSSPADVRFTLPPGPAGKSWYFVGESCARAEQAEPFLSAGQERKLPAPSLDICPRGVALFLAR